MLQVFLNPVAASGHTLVSIVNQKSLQLVRMQASISSISRSRTASQSSRSVSESHDTPVLPIMRPALRGSSTEEIVHRRYTTAILSNHPCLYLFDTDLICSSSLFLSVFLSYELFITSRSILFYFSLCRVVASDPRLVDKRALLQICFASVLHCVFANCDFQQIPGLQMAHSGPAERIESYVQALPMSAYLAKPR